jgi:P-type E1-E2 ATPase
LQAAGGGHAGEGLQNPLGLRGGGDKVYLSQNQQSLRATVEASEMVQLWDGRRVDSRRVVPGDVLLLPRAATLHVDAALLAGSALLNESMLTG